MDVTALRSYYQVARLRSFSKAAKVLRVSQSTVSTHITQLEKGLGVALINRETRPVQVTVLGAHLLESVEVFLANLSLIQEQASSREVEGPAVAIAATDLMVECFLPKVVRAYRESHLDVHLRIEAGPVDLILDKVESGEADVAFAPAYYRQGLALRELFSYSRLLITPLGHPLLDKPLLSLHQLRPWPVISPPSGSVSRATIEAEFHRRGLVFKPMVELRGYQTIKRYVALGVGIAIVPALAMNPGDREALGVIDMKGLLPGGTGGMYHRPTAHPGHMLREFISTVLEVVRTPDQH